MTNPFFSYSQLATAIDRVRRPECIKPLRARESEAELLLEQLKAAAAELRKLEAERATGVGR